jgi:predicted transcriptional regulator
MAIELKNGRDIRALRNSRGVAIGTLAEMLDVPVEALRAVERGKMPAHPDILAKAQQLLEQIAETAIA